MVERVAPGDAGGVDENESEKQKDVDSSSSETATETTATKTATDRPQMQAPRDFGSTSSADSESGGTESSSTSEETATRQPTKGPTTDRPQMEAPSDEPNRFATSEGRTPEDKAPAPGGEPQMEARMDEPMRGPVSRPGSQRSDARSAPGDGPDRVRPDSSRADLDAAAQAAEERSREVRGIGAAEEQRRRTINAGTRDTDAPSEASEEGKIGGALDSIAPGLTAEQAATAAAAPAAATAGVLSDRVDSPSVDIPDMGFDASDAAVFATLPGQVAADRAADAAPTVDFADGTAYEPGSLTSRSDVRGGSRSATASRSERRSAASDVSIPGLVPDIDASDAAGVATLPAQTLLNADLSASGDVGTLTTRSDVRGGGESDTVSRSERRSSASDVSIPDLGLDAEQRADVDRAGEFATLPGQLAGEAWENFDETLRARGTPDDPQASGFERTVRGWVGDPGKGVRERGSGLRNILQEDVLVGETDVQAAARSTAAGLVGEIDPTGDGPIQSVVEQEEIDAGPPVGFGLFGGAGAVRSAPSYLQALRGSRVAGGASRTGPTGSQLAESVGSQGQFAAQGVEGLLRAGTAIGSVGLGLSEIEAPESREEFAQEEIAAPEEPSDFNPEELAPPESRDDFSTEEIAAPEDPGAGLFSEIGVPSDLGSGPGSDSVVINDNGDVSVILSANQMFRELEEEEDDILDVPDEFLPEDDEVFIGGREETVDEVTEQVEEPSVTWDQPRDLFSDEPATSEPESLAEPFDEPLGDTFLEEQSTETVSQPSVGTGTGVGGLLDEEADTGIDSRPGAETDDLVDVGPDIGQPTAPDQGLGLGTGLALGNVVETGAETATDPGHEFGNPPGEEFAFEFGGAGAGAGALAPRGPPLAPDSRSGSSDSSFNFFEQQYEFEVAEPESVLFGSDTKEKRKGDDDFFGEVGDFGGGLDIGDLGQGFGSLDDF